MTSDIFYFGQLNIVNNLQCASEQERLQDDRDHAYQHRVVEQRCLYSSRLVVEEVVVLSLATRISEPVAEHPVRKQLLLVYFLL